VTVAFVGSGNVLGAYLAVLDRLVARGVARPGLVHARSEERATALRRRRPAISTTPSLEAVLDSNADVVVVLTPPVTHADHVRAAIDAGKHVIAEKPLALDADEAADLFARASAQGVVLMAAPFTPLSPVLRAIWTRVHDGEIGHLHSARCLYGNAGSTWSTWYHTSGIGPLPEIGIYHLTTLTALVGPIVSVNAAQSVAVAPRVVGDVVIESPDPDIVHVIARHAGGALSSIVAGQAIQQYQRPGLELYGTEGSINLIGDDWDPHGYEIWRNASRSWERFASPDLTWSWADGLRELVMALHDGRAPLRWPDQVVHVIDVIAAARDAAASGREVGVTSRHPIPDLRIALTSSGYLHDHTRSPEDQ
jgi:predicted dehydrogenase